MAYLRELYEETILDHNRNPRNFMSVPEGGNRHAHGFNPVCNDEFTVHLRVEDGIIKDAGFEGAGCAISTASASLMTESIKGKTEAEVGELLQGVHNMLMEQGDAGDVGKLEVLAGVREYPMRIKCATLPWHTLRAALDRKQETVSTEPGNNDRE
ncbi:MAG: SUF system NifU family Fe-S cluster assembly protein [Gammaproteobacteria bacterium]|jgi:nitrogen fixation NifU-like protein